MSVGTGGTTRLAARGDYEGYRRWLLVFASGAVVFGLLHHTDHVIRGNHSGWPFQPEVTPFTFSLLIYALILPGIYLTARGRSVPGYHLFVAVVGLALLGFVHFVPTEDFEAPIQDIFLVYETPLAGMLALGVLAGLIASVAALGAVAIGAIRARSNHARRLDDATKDGPVGEPAPGGHADRQRVRNVGGRASGGGEAEPARASQG